MPKATNEYDSTTYSVKTEIRNMFPTNVCAQNI